MPLHPPTVPTARLLRLARAAALAAACATAGAVTIAIADDQSSPQTRTIAEPPQPVATRYFDVEANKAASMRALGRYIADQRARRTPRYRDLEANKSSSQRAR